MNSNEAHDTAENYCIVCGDPLIDTVERNGKFLCSESCADMWDEIVSIHEDLFVD